MYLNFNSPYIIKNGKLLLPSLWFGGKLASEAYT